MLQNHTYTLTHKHMQGCKINKFKISQMDNYKGLRKCKVDGIKGSERILRGYRIKELKN